MLRPNARKFVDDIIVTTLTSLTALSRTARRPAYGATFLLNNVSYLRDHLVLSSSQLTSLLAPPAIDSLHSSFRTAKAAYFDAHFTPLIQVLGDEPKEKSGLRGGGSSVAKEKFVKFYELLDEVVETHQVARLLPDDQDGRENIVEEVVKLVVPSLRRFIQKNKEKEFSKSECD
jgi:exocyst complex protein 7